MVELANTTVDTSKVAPLYSNKHDARGVQIIKEDQETGEITVSTPNRGPLTLNYKQGPLKPVQYIEETQLVENLPVYPTSSPISHHEKAPIETITVFDRASVQHTHVASAAD